MTLATMVPGSTPKQERDRTEQIVVDHGVRVGFALVGLRGC